MSLKNMELSAKGSRRLTLSMTAVRAQADRFEGLPRGMGKPLRFLAAFQEAEPYLGLPPQAYKLIAWLVKMTQAQDWEAGSRPLVWPSAARQADFLGLSRNAVKTLNRVLFEAGVLVMRDSPTGKRYGRRDDRGLIVEAYGFDLSPLAFRYDEFIRIAAQARAERERMQALKRRATCARRSLAQIGETLIANGGPPPDWPQLAAAAAERIAALRKARTPEDLAAIVKALESWNSQALAWTTELYQTRKTIPEGPVDGPLTISTNSSSHPSDTVLADEKRNRAETVARPTEAKLGANPAPQDKIAAREFENAAKVHPRELLQLAPRLADYAPQPFPDWADIVNAAGEGLRVELGVSPSLWSEACLTVGRPLAAIALAIVSTKPAEHFTRGAGGYFAAMIKRAKTGELRLDRSLWKLRRERLEARAALPWP